MSSMSGIDREIYLPLERLVAITARISAARIAVQLCAVIGAMERAGHREDHLGI